MLPAYKPNFCLLQLCALKFDKYINIAKLGVDVSIIYEIFGKKRVF